jgi:hypothetical protein
MAVEAAAVRGRPDGTGWPRRWPRERRNAWISAAEEDWRNLKLQVLLLL